MQMSAQRLTAALAVLTASGVVLAGCASGDAPAAGGSSPEVGGSVTITVGEMPTSDKTSELENFTKKVAEFEALHPGVTVVGDENSYKPSTFNALLVGGTAPTTMAIPFTDMQALIERGQAADITDLLAKNEALSQLSPDLDSAVQADGRTYGVVREAYAMSLHYNRALYAEAGLDPDKPPTDWNGVLENARTITEKTGKTGFIIPTTNNAGGWLLTTMSYSAGSLVQEVSGDTVTVTIDTPGMQAALQLLHDVRWGTPPAAGANFLLSGDDIRSEFAAGNVGQTVNGSLYGDLVVNRGMQGEDIGIAPMPQGPKGLGALGGGAIQWYNPKATPEQLEAALAWTEFYWLDQYMNEDAAKAWASARAADGRPVGVPEVPLISAEAYETYLGWIKDSINVDRDRYTAYLESSLPIVAEPSVKAQEIYAALDPIAQAVLTDENVDIAKMLADAQSQVQALVDAG